MFIPLLSFVLMTFNRYSTNSSVSFFYFFPSKLTGKQKPVKSHLSCFFVCVFLFCVPNKTFYWSWVYILRSLEAIRSHKISQFDTISFIFDFFSLDLDRKTKTANAIRDDFASVVLRCDQFGGVRKQSKKVMIFSSNYQLVASNVMFMNPLVKQLSQFSIFFRQLARRSGQGECFAIR